MVRILIVEDDRELSKIMGLELKHEGFDVAHAYDGREALDAVSADKGGDFDLMLLDVMLPKLSGLEVLRKLRSQGEESGRNNLPVILVTARGETIDKVDGLNSGADDYITKPFKIEELLARINAVLRRTKSEGQKTGVLRNGSIVMTVDEMKVVRTRADNEGKTEKVELSKIEFLLLKLFLENQEKVLGREQIIKTVWGDEYYIEDNSVDVYVRHLRSKFGDDIIRTVRGMGYIMKSSD